VSAEEPADAPAGRIRRLMGAPYGACDVTPDHATELGSGRDSPGESDRRLDSDQPSAADSRVVRRARESDPCIRLVVAEQSEMGAS
jgi:hypothetical protein